MNVSSLLNLAEPSFNLLFKLLSKGIRLIGIDLETPTPQLLDAFTIMVPLTAFTS